MIKPIKGFSKLSKEAKIESIVSNYKEDASYTMEKLEGYCLPCIALPMSDVVIAQA